MFDNFKVGANIAYVDGGGGSITSRNSTDGLLLGACGPRPTSTTRSTSTRSRGCTGLLVSPIRRQGQSRPHASMTIRSSWRTNPSVRRRGRPYLRRHKRGVHGHPASPPGCRCLITPTTSVPRPGPAAGPAPRWWGSTELAALTRATSRLSRSTTTWTATANTRLACVQRLGDGGPEPQLQRLPDPAIAGDRLGTSHRSRITSATLRPSCRLMTTNRPSGSSCTSPR